MDSGTIFLASLLLGLICGVAITAVLFWAIQKSESIKAVANQDVPDGVVAVINSLAGVGIVVDSSNRVVTYSQAALNTDWFENQQLIKAKVVELLDEVRRTGEAGIFEIRETSGDEIKQLWSLSVAPLGSRFMLIVADDNTEAERLAIIRADFIANVSHELKTPIGAVRLLAEAIEQSIDEPKTVHRFVTQLQKEAIRLSDLTQEIIQLSKLENTQAITQLETLKVDKLVGKAIDLVQVPASSANIKIIVNKEPDAKVLGNESLLVSAIHNVLINAVTHSDEGARVGIGIKIVKQNVEISITDQGPGIPAEDLERIFERFYRSDESRVRTSGGTGLGLSIVKHVVRRHSGTVKVWSQLGRGSTFTICLPQMPKVNK